MKKNCFQLLMPTLLFFFLSEDAGAQNTSPYWSLAGNSNATAASKLGTTNATSLRIYSNDVQRMIVHYSTGNVGIGTIDPTERLHVNSLSGKSPFRAQVNGNTKLLVHSSGGVSVGANIAPPTNGLYVAGNTGIGIAAPTRKLHVVGNAQFTDNLNVSEGGLNATNNSGAGVSGYGTTYGLYGYGSTGDAASVGVYGTGNTAGVSGNGVSYGVYGKSAQYGVYGTGDNYGVYGIAYTYGVYGESGANWGVYGKSGWAGVAGRGDVYGVIGSTVNAYGVYGSSPGGTGVYGISTAFRGVYGYSTNNIGGYFHSENSNALWAKTASTAAGVYAGVFEGNVYTYGVYTTSDKNLKKNVENVGSAMRLLNQLKPKMYEFKNEGKYAAMALPK
ncbi:MAG TPA: tail fiber domain-containing protein, partial [Flavisolibacter sp.]|nr:tail fiber domain-containing protein [Flavisolibacter sp.]